MSVVKPADGARTVTVRIQGNVQGVGFRNWMQRMAGQLCLTGWVRNRRDGSVEALLCGDRARGEEALQRCQSGPRSAKVTGVAVLSEAGPAVDGFQILPGL